MKVILGLIVVFGLGGLALYYAGGYSSFDPSEQGREHRAKIASGMTWKEVMEINPPKKWRTLIKKKQMIGKDEIETTEWGPQNSFIEERLATRLAEDSLPDGFRFDYVYSGAVAYCVVFDGKGSVEEVQDLTTMSDLLQIEK